MVIEAGNGGLKRAAIYRRVSNTNDERTASLDGQLEATLRKLQALGYHVDPERDVFTDHITGAVLDERPGLASLREEVRRKAYAAVGFYALDRLSRDMGQTAVIYAEFDRFGVVTVSATEDISTTPEGMLMTFIRSYFAQIERAKISQRNKLGRAKLLAVGKLPCAGYAKFGYVYDQVEKRRVIDEPARAIVDMIFKLCVQLRMSANAIARHLNAIPVPSPHKYRIERGWVTPKKRTGEPKWTSTSVLLVLRDPTYTGVTFTDRYKIDGRCTTGAYRGVRRPREDWKVLDDTGTLTERIVSDADFALAQALLDGNDSHAGAARTRNRGHQALLRGMIYCEGCDRRMYYEPGNGKERPVYRCRWARLGEKRPCRKSRIRQEVVEEATWDALVALIEEDGRLEAALEVIAKDGRGEALAANLDDVQRLLADAVVEQDAVYREYRAALRERKDSLAQRLKADYDACEVVVAAYRESAADLTAKVASRTSKAAVAANFRARFDRIIAGIRAGDLTWQEKRDALEMAGTKVVGTSAGATAYFEVFDVPGVSAIPSRWSGGNACLVNVDLNLLVPSHCV